MNIDQLIKKFEDAYESHELFKMLGDNNMAAAWAEQCEFIYEKINKLNGEKNEHTTA